MRKKRLMALAVILGAAIMATGCKDKGPTKEELQADLDSMTSTAGGYLSQVKQLKMILANYNSNESMVQGLDDYISLAADQGAYLAFDDKINVENPIKLEPNTPIQNETLLYLTNTVTFSPNQNWIVRAGSGHMELSHESGVYGEVDCYTYNGDVGSGYVYDEFIKPHFDAIRGEEIGSPSTIFLASGARAGYQATCRLKVAKMDDNTLHIQEEEMTAPYVETSEGEVTDESNAESNAESVAESETASETAAESVAESTAEGETSGEVAEGEASSEGESLAAGELTGEVVSQDEEKTVTIENYLYTVAVAEYYVDEYEQQAIVFKFFYPEGNASEVATKQEFIGNTIKSFSINGNPLTLQ